MNFRRNLRRNNSGIGTVFGMVFFLLIVMIVFASFVILLNQNTSLEQTTIQAKQLDLDRYTELTTVSISDPEIAILNHVVYVGCNIMNNGTLPTQLVRLWIKDITQNTVNNIIMTPSITLQPGHDTAFFNSAYVTNASSSDQIAFWFITTRGNTISAYPDTNQLNSIISSGAFPGVTDINSTYNGEIYNPLQLSLTTTKPNQLIYVVVSYDDENTLYTPTSTPSLTWTKRSQSLDTDYGYFMDGDSTLETYYAIKPSIGLLTINVESTADHLNDYYCSALAFAISDVNTTAPFDGAAQTTVAKSTMPQDTITTHFSNELVIGAISIDSLNPQINPGAGFAEIMPVQSSYGASGEPDAQPRSVWSEWAIIDTPTTNLPVNCTFTSPKNWAIIVDAVRLIAIPPTTPVSLSPNSGPIGQSITVSGNGFATNSPLLALFDGLPIPFSATTDSNGAIPSNAKFTVPIGSTAGNKTVTIVDRSFNYANTTFLVTTPSIAVSPTSGPIGTAVTVTGSNFVDNSTININFNGNPTVTNPSSITADASGSFLATFIFSSNDTAGIKQISANDGFNSAFANFAVAPTITLNPTNGPIGSLVNVIGSGFAATQPVTITFAGATAVTIPTNLNTDSSGFFSASFTIPAGQTAGGRTVNASDATLNSATSTFAITPSIFLSPASENIGSTVTVSGSGFASNSALIAKFAGSTVTLGGTITTNSSGGFAGTTFTVPTWVPTWATGSVQTVNITDASSNSGSNTYTVNTVSQSITVTMSNFAPSAAVTVNGGNAIPNTFPADGNSHLVTMFAGASFTLSFSNSGNTRNGFIVASAFSANSITYTTSVTPVTATSYAQVQNTFSSIFNGGSISGDSLALQGTYLGTSLYTIASLTYNTWSVLAWSDYNTVVTFPTSTALSGSTQRWAINSVYSTAALTTGGNSYSTPYYHQFLQTLSYSIFGGGSPTAPTATGTTFGLSSAPSLTNTAAGYWFDASGSIIFSTSAGGVREQWAPIPASISATSAQTQIVSMHHQYQVSFAASGLGSVAASTRVLSVGGSDVLYSQLPFTSWFDSGTTYSYYSTVAGSVSGTQFALTGTSPASPINGTTGATVTGTYKTLHYIDSSNAIHDTPVGAHSSFPAMQTGPDSVYDTLTEENTIPTTTTMGTMTDTSISYTSILRNNLAGQAFTAPTNAISVASITFYGRTSSGTFNVKAIITDGSGNILPNGVSGFVSCSTTAQSRTATFTTPPTITPGSTYWILIISPTSSFRLYYVGTTGGISKIDTTNNYATPTNPTDATTAAVNYRTFYATVNRANYQLDQEVQFTNVTNFASYTQLQIQTGTFSTPAETIAVDYWNGASWINLGTLTANSLNTFTISLTSSTYEIRFTDGTGTNDYVQSTWQIDSVVLIAP